MKNFILMSIGVVLLLAGGIFWSRSLQSDQADIISRNGIHWHPEIEIFADGKQIEIPQSMGLVGKHSPIHTHEDLPIIHLEFDGLVKESDVRLGKFFEVWRKSFYELGQDVSMTVNGVDNTEFENYLMQDGDKIELKYK